MVNYQIFDPKILFLKIFDSELLYIEVWCTNQNFKPPEIKKKKKKKKINVTLVINKNITYKK